MKDQIVPPAGTRRAADLPGMLERLHPAWERRRFILRAAGIVALLTLAVNFLLPVRYRSTSTILPEAEKSKLSALSQFAGVAQLAGVSLPGSEIARLYPAMVSSETVLRPVILRKYRTAAFPEEVDLIRYFDLEEETGEQNMDRALRKVRDLLSSSVEARTGIVTVTLDMPEPSLAADALNAIVTEVDRFMRLKKAGNATEQLRWIEQRMPEVNRELRAAEDSLKEFRERNRRVLDSPQLLLMQERLIREVTVKSAIVIELKKQYELAKIDEIKNLTIVNVLDPARPAVRKESPRRAVNTILAFFAGLLGAAAWVLVDASQGDRLRAVLRTLRRPAAPQPGP
jgi:uncharacterized protein involved in exopolysaccharide biosynthesis